MNKPNIEIVATRSFASAVADEIVMVIRDSIEEHGKCCIALAGGGTPGTTYRLLSRPPHVQDIDWGKVFLFWGDERWVAHDDTQSNFRMSRETLIDKIPIPADNLFPVNTSAESPQVAASEYSETIQKVVRSSGENIVFDIILLGIGDDGHTASLFPESPALSVADTEICVATSKPDGSPRITLTPAVLKSAAHVIYMASGESKAEMVHTLIEGPQDVNAYPASIYHSMNGKVSWFIDTAAATKLERE